MNKVKSLIYEAPIARDLSGFSVEGQVSPNAICENGTAVISPGCAIGPNPDTGSCAPYGYHAGTGGCGSGGTPDVAWPDCNVGTSAAEGCWTGTAYH